MRCVLQPVGDDDKDRIRRYILLADVFVDIFDVMDGVTHRIDQGGGAGSQVIFSLHLLDLYKIDAVMDDLTVLIEENGGDKAASVFFLLFFQKRVVSADRI